MDMMQLRGIWHISHIGYIVAQCDRIADTDNTLIIILINMEKPATSINA